MSASRCSVCARAILVLAMVTPLCLAGPRRAAAYEAETTHVGLTERAAKAAKLHSLLSRHLGRAQGLLEPLPSRLPAAVVGRLSRLSPVEGLRPDDRGENRALGWLLAGAALEGVPPARVRHHFFDPRTGRGLSAHGTLTRLMYFFVGDREVGQSFNLTGRPAPEWAVAPPEENELGLPVFLDAMAESATAAEPAGRAAALARALLSAGALMHLVEDMASPSHVRNDLREHLERQPGSTVLDQRSRYEQYVAQRWGRLGVPAVPPGAIPAHARLRDYFTGLAAWVEPRFFSAGTLPDPIALDPEGQVEVALGKANDHLRRPLPRLPTQGTPGAGAGTLGSAEVPVLASYVVDRDLVQFALDERAFASYAGILLPRAAASAAGLLAFLFRGQLSVARDGDALVVNNAGGTLSRGTLTLLGEDGAGRRKVMSTSGAAAWPVRNGAELGRAAALPADVRRVVALFRGQDDQGEPLVAIEDVVPPPPPPPVAQHEEPPAQP
jgi:hypothetical protein